MNLAIAFQTARKKMRQNAVFYGEREISYAELHAQSLKIAAQLQDRLSVKPGDRVALWLKNRPEFVTAVFGILHAARRRAGQQFFSSLRR